MFQVDLNLHRHSAVFSSWTQIEKPFVVQPALLHRGKVQESTAWLSSHRNSNACHCSLSTWSGNHGNCIKQSGGASDDKSGFTAGWSIMSSNGTAPERLRRGYPAINWLKSIVPVRFYNKYIRPAFTVDTLIRQLLRGLLFDLCMASTEVLHLKVLHVTF